MTNHSRDSYTKSLTVVFLVLMICLNQKLSLFTESCGIPNNSSFSVYAAKATLQ